MGYAEQCGAQYDGRNWAAFLEISVSSFCLKKDGMPVQLDGQNWYKPLFAGTLILGGGFKYFLFPPLSGEDPHRG